VSTVARPRAAGFTLLEVLIALSITAMVGAILLGTFRSVDRAGEIVRDQGDRFGASRVALTRLARELAMAFVSDHYDRNRYRERPTVFVGREDTLLFTTMAHERLWLDARESDQAVVEYTLDDDPAHREGKALFRREKVRIDAEPDRDGRRDLVADHVTELRFRYWDQQRKEWVREWSTRSTDHSGELPLRVKVELDTRLMDGRTERFVTEARIAITRPLDF
jgi:general secretion pathway protein J